MAALADSANTDQRSQCSKKYMLRIDGGLPLSRSLSGSHEDMRLKMKTHHTPSLLFTLEHFISFCIEQFYVFGKL